MLSGINALIVRVRTREELFAGACRIALEAGAFRMSLVAVVDRATMSIVPVASEGKDEELMASIRAVLSSAEDAPRTMVARAIRDKKAVVSNDAVDDPQVLFGGKYLASGVRSMAVFPLVVSDEALGVLALYSGQAGFFDQEEMKLLSELAGDIAFAMDHIQKQEHLDYLAYYDELTGLANRSLFLERVAQYIRSAAAAGHQLALFLVDLERFKNINDSLGRPAGDALLRHVAGWLTRSVGDASLLARLGADHFAVVLPEVRQGGDVARLLEKSMAAFLEHPFQLDESVLRIAARVGVALFPEDGADAEGLLRNAEAALKKAKASGDRYLFYTQQMTAAVAGKLTLENQLRQALEREEFVLHYQPKVSLASGRLAGAEALIRWNDPRTGLVPPGRFIAVLEETGLIFEVGRWALRKAIGEYLRWRAAGLPAVRQRGERLAAAAAQPRLHRRGRAGDRRRRARRGGAGARDHRERDHGGREAQHRHPEGDPRHGRHRRHRRLRHRLLVAELSRQAAGGHAEDRPLVRGRHDARARGPGAGVHHHRPGARAEAQGGGRGRRDRGAVAPAAAAELRRDAGLPVQQAGAGRDLRGEIPRAASALIPGPARRRPRSRAARRGKPIVPSRKETARNGIAVAGPRVLKAFGQGGILGETPNARSNPRLALPAGLCAAEQSAPGPGQRMCRRSGALGAPMPPRANGNARRISTELGAVLLDTLGLAAAIEWHARWLQRCTGVRCELTVSDAAGIDLPEACAATIFGIYGETLSNVARHPGASRVAIALTITARQVTMVVRDNGSGPATTLRLGLAAA